MFEGRESRRKQGGEAERGTAGALGHLPVAKAPESIWQSIEAELDHPVSRREQSGGPIRNPMWMRWALAAATLVVILGSAFYWRSVHRIRWEVVRTAGSQERTETIGVG